jgi:ADP-heptose:LPS heptosyltransferase
MRRILFIRLRELGDAILTTPALRQLKRLHPDAELDVLCEPRTAVVYRHNPHVRQCYHLPRRCSAREFVALACRLWWRGYDMVIDPQSLPKTAVLARLTGAGRRYGFHRRWIANRLTYTHTVMPLPMAEYTCRSTLRLLRDDRVDFADVRPDFYIREEEQEEAERFCRQWFRGPVVAVCVGSRFDYKRWSPEKFAVVADRLEDWGFQTMLVYGPGEAQLAQDVAAQMHHRPICGYPMVSFPVLKGIMEGCCLFVGVDGGPNHIAKACDVPSVTLFGGIHPEIWTAPDNPRQRFVGTRADARLHPVTRGRCVNVDLVQDIPADVVWEEVASLLDSGLVTVAPASKRIA